MFTTTRWTASHTALVLATALSAAAILPAQMTNARPAPALASASATVVDERISASVHQNGSASVILRLRTTFRPEGDLSAAARDAQRGTIRQLRTSLVARLGSGATQVRGYDEVPFVSLTVDSQGLSVLRRSPEVVRVDEDQMLTIADDGGQATGTVSSSNAPAWWHLRQTGTYSSWQQGYDGLGQTVAILDTGVQRDHPWLTGKVVAEACFSTARTCPNGATYQYGAGAARPCNFHTQCAHGTHVAGIAAGKYGVARRASIIAVQVMQPGATRPTYATSDLINGLRYVYQMRSQFRIAAVNISLGGGRSYGYCDDRTNASSFFAWADALRSVGIATVVSSGNDGWSDSMGSPACNSNVISVGNTTIDSSGVDAVWHTSNSAATLTLLAPGTQICSSIPNSSSSCAYTGTSMAAPVVAGAIAALKQLRPTATVASEINALHYSGTSVSDSRNGIVRTRINVPGALHWLYTH